MTSAAIVTSSDGVSSGFRDDASGDALEELLDGAGFDVHREVVPDERQEIAHTLRRLADTDVRLVVVTGGTGFGPRDVTPEATRDVIDREAPGLAEAMRAAGRASTPMADLSRGIVGSVGRTLVVNVPGSPRGAVESVEAILGLLPHAIELLGGDTEHPTGAPTPTHAGKGKLVSAGGGESESAEQHARAHRHAHGEASDRGGEDASPPGRAAGPDHGHDHAHGSPSCDLAHGIGDVPERSWRLVALSASPVALQLHHLARLVGWATVLVEPDADRVTDQHAAHADLVVASVADAGVDADTDVVATDHDTDHLHELLVAALESDARWIGLMGSPRHTPPHIEGLRTVGYDDDEIARIHRPIGLDIGSHTPAEIAVSTIAGLLADRNDRHGTY